MLLQLPAEHSPPCLHVVLSSRFYQYCVWLVRFRLLCPQRQAQKAPATVRVIKCPTGHVDTYFYWELGDVQYTVEKLSLS